MEPQSAIGLAHFIAQTDAVGKALLVVLLLMSATTWTLIVAKLVHAARRRVITRNFLDVFWGATNVQALATHLDRDAPREPFSRLASHALQAARHRTDPAADGTEEGSTQAGFLTRAMRRVLDEETARCEAGLTTLASIGSTAPFIGLFGTVWGIYHALLAISAAGAITIDKVSGPVGEALVMTAAGLAVAIPAVLAYNVFGKIVGACEAELEGFAHDLREMITGSAEES